MNPRKIILEINKTLRTNKLEQESKKKKEKRKRGFKEYRLNSAIHIR